MTLQEINEFIDQQKFDITKSRNSRFMDQKCTPDVVCAVSECVLNYTNEDNAKSFTKNDIWHYQYSSDLLEEYFTKPNANREDMQREYDKFFGQPLLLLASSGVLADIGSNDRHTYVVANREVLDYISQSDRTSTKFLNAYLTKVMSDSGMIHFFDNFFSQQDSVSLEILRNALVSFYKTHTNIKGDYEPPRIYNKIINILAFARRKKGSIQGRISDDILSTSDIMYNRVNWRDINKQRTMSRQEAVALIQTTQDIGSFNYAVSKAKNQVKRLHPFSEIHRFEDYPATQAHHIFLASEYPELADCIENIICLTPNQHFYMAHPGNKTSVADLDYRIVCLLCKLDSIEMNFRDGRDDYSLTEFVNVLNVGLSTSDFNDRMSFEDIKFNIMKHSYYQKYVQLRTAENKG